jgi:hypothetical protein
LVKIVVNCTKEHKKVCGESLEERDVGLNEKKNFNVISLFV